MIDILPYLAIAVTCVVLLELLTGRIVTQGYVLGTRRSENPTRYWGYILWQCGVVIALVWLYEYAIHAKQHG